MTMLTAGALTDPQLPATALNVCTTDARLGGVGRVPPPNQKSWLCQCHLCFLQALLISPLFQCAHTHHSSHHSFFISPSLAMFRSRKAMSVEPALKFTVDICRGRSELTSRSRCSLRVVRGWSWSNRTQWWPQTQIFPPLTSTSSSTLTTTNSRAWLRTSTKS